MRLSINKSPEITASDKMERVNWNYAFRLIVIGDSRVGKTALLNAFDNRIFRNATEPTIGVDYFNKIITLSNNVRINIKAFDTAGEEKYK